MRWGMSLQLYGAASSLMGCPQCAGVLWDLVIADMHASDRMGEQKYGTRLQPHNGRDALRDAYQEALDLCVYLRQAIYEKDGR
jgi:hypothetical protein